MLSLNNKKIILGISGGIAAYKSAELCRTLIRAGASVRVVMTDGAREFITPLTLQALSGNRVHTSLLDEAAEAAMGHIELARWADLIIIAPASANTLARLAHGEAGDLLTTLCLASAAPILLAPAMNQQMWLDGTTQTNIRCLADRGYHIAGPDSGAQACGEVGPGRMLEPEVIAAHAATLFESGLLAGRQVLITAGPTREAIDPVRYISNHSSGKMGYALAQAAIDAGARVTLVSGPVALVAPEQARVIQVESAAQMLAACQQEQTDIFIAVAAVADYRAAQVADNKIKKHEDALTLQLVRNPDILATIAGTQPRPFCIGFAAETNNIEGYAKDKLRQKNLDMIFANDATATFGSEDASITAYWLENGKEEEKSLPRAGKSQLARQMISLIHEHYFPHG